MSASLYVLNPDREAPWNQLPDLPIAPGLHETLPVYKQLGAAKEALGRLHGRSVAIPDPALLITSLSLQEARASSAIENIFTTDDELYRAFSDGQQVQPEGPVKEVLRYREALGEGVGYLRQHPRFTRDYFVRIFQTVKQTSDGIRPPQAQVRILQAGSGPGAGRVVYTPPRGAGVLEAKLDNLCAFLNATDDGLDPLLKMAIAHYQFEAIHPFRDGNGRTGRIFNLHYLTQQRLLDQPTLYLSRYILAHKTDYYAALAGVSQRADWPTWLLFMLRAVAETANSTFDKIDRILAAQAAVLALVAREKTIRRPELLVQKIFTQPITRVRHLTADGSFAQNTARTYLNRLAELRLLQKSTLRGNDYYLNPELYSILAD